MTSEDASVRMTSAAELREKMRRLQAAGASLRARDAHDVAEILCAVLDSWRDPTSPWRTRLERELPATSGFSEALVREGLSRALKDWNGDALRALIARELGSFAPQRGAKPGAPLVQGFESTALLLAGAIPMPTLLASILPLLLRSPVLAKTSARDPITAQLVAESIRQHDAELGRCIEIASFPGSDDARTRALLEAPCVVAYGSDETLRAVRERMNPAQRLVGHGHRLSVAVLGEAATRAGALTQVAQRLALDTVLWDQLGCLSPVAVFVEDASGGAGERVASELATAIGEASRKWPRGELPAGAAAAVVHERSECEMRSAAGRRSALHTCDDLGWTVALEADAEWRPAPLHRFLRIHPLDSLGELGTALAPVSAHLATIAVAGLDDARRRELASLGASRICAPGEMQTPPLAWHHDGQPLLLPMARFTDFE